MGGSGRTWAAPKSRRYLYRLGPSGSPKQKHPSHARPGSQPRTLRLAPTKTHLARPPAIQPLPLIAWSQTQSRHVIPAVHRSPPQRFSGWLLAVLFITCNDAGNGLRNGVRRLASNHPGLLPSPGPECTLPRPAGELENGLKIVEADFNLPHTPNHIKGRDMAFPNPKVTLARRKCTIYGAHVLGLV